MLYGPTRVVLGRKAKISFGVFRECKTTTLVKLVFQEIQIHGATRC